jgi:hypothetical protein
MSETDNMGKEDINTERKEEGKEASNERKKRSREHGNNRERIVDAK